MNDVLITLSILLVALSWRAVTFQYEESVQPWLHAVPCLAWLPQWYTVLFAGLGCMLVRTLLDFYHYEVLGYDLLSPEKVEKALDTIPGMTPSERDSLAIHDWLKCGSLAAPVAGVVTALRVAWHVLQLVWYEAGRRDELRWCMSYEVDLVLMVVAMPLVFALMAMRAEVRILAVMTGSAWQTVVDAGPPLVSWPDLKASEMSMYTAELQVACIFQYCTFWNIGALCVQYMRDIPDEYHSALKWAGLQGIALYFLAGTVVSVGDMLAPACALNKEWGTVAAEWWQEVALPFITPVAWASMCLCVYNIVMFGYLKVVQDALSDWTYRMLATAALVVCAQFQLPVISAFTVGALVYNVVNPAVLSGFGYDFSPERAALLHAVLLNFECLLVVVANGSMWDPKKAYTAGDGPRRSQAAVRAGRRPDGTPTMEEPLLPQGRVL